MTGLIITIIALIGALILTVYWPEPDATRQPPGSPPPRSRRRVPGCGDCALTNHPPCAEHRARPAFRMSPWHTERIVYTVPNPQDFTALEHLLADKDSLAEASVSEQEARRP